MSKGFFSKTNVYNSQKMLKLRTILVINFYNECTALFEASRFNIHYSTLIILDQSVLMNHVHRIVDCWQCENVIQMLCCCACGSPEILRGDGLSGLGLCGRLMASKLSAYRFDTFLSVQYP